jgi:hypothetical protein
MQYPTLWVRQPSWLLLPAWLLTGLLVAGCLPPTRAQETDHFQVGLKAGINFAELLGADAVPESDYKEGYSFGLYASYALRENLQLQPELIWSLQGEKSEAKGRYSISYVNVPLMLKWTEGKFYTELGPQLGILTIQPRQPLPGDTVAASFDRFDLSVNAGLGYKFWDDWSIGLRYCHGLTNLVEGLDLRNSVIYLGLAYRLW